MKSHGKLLLSRVHRSELVRLCNETLICAARDLAEFTKNGLNASFIVALAHKCEHYETLMDQQTTPIQTQKESSLVEEEIRQSLDRICELGRRIWSKHPSKYKDYVLAQKSTNSFGEPGAPRVA